MEYTEYATYFSVINDNDYEDSSQNHFSYVIKFTQKKQVGISSKLYLREFKD